MEKTAYIGKKHNRKRAYLDKENPHVKHTYYYYYYLLVDAFIRNNQKTSSKTEKINHYHNYRKEKNAVVLSF